MPYKDYEKQKTNALKWQKENKDKYNLRLRKWRLLNLERERERKRILQSKWVKINPEVVKVIAKKYRKAHLSRILARNAFRRANKLKQTPVWAEVNEITRFYENCPNGHHVDHILPLNGKLIRGLHVLSNLQYLPAAENIAKGNMFEIN